MIQSRSQSPDTGMSAGIDSMKVLLVAAGASAGLKKRPVKFVRKNSEIMAKGPNLTAWTRGNFRGNFILILHVSDGPGPPRLLSNRGSARLLLNYYSLAFYRFAWPIDIQ